MARGGGGAPYGGMPYGGMGGIGGPGNEQDRERSTWLQEDDLVWGADPDVPPGVLGRQH